MATERKEDYLEAIDSIVAERGRTRAKDISEYLKVSPSTATEMLQKLDCEGYINHEKYKGVTLTKKGLRVAHETRRKHEVLREFLEILGIDEDLADEDACRMEHILNPKTLERLTRFVEFVKHSKSPRWLEKFRHYYETGEQPRCKRV
jgi:DtxR family Mn-dependent transcriptional regulator